MKPGDLVQCNIFDDAGSGGYGLVLSASRPAGFWTIQWAGSESDFPGAFASTHEIHENSLVIVSERELDGNF